MPQFNMTDEETSVLADYLSMVMQTPGVNLASADSKQFTPQMASLGKQLYEVKYQCQSCHTIGSAGGYVGPNLTNAGNWINAAWTEEWLKNPQSLQPEAIEPHRDFTDEERTALTAYLMTLKQSASAPAGGAIGEGPMKLDCQLAVAASPASDLMARRRCRLVAPARLSCCRFGHFLPPEPRGGRARSPRAGLRQRGGLERCYASDPAQLSAGARQARVLPILRVVPRGFHARRPLEPLESESQSSAGQRWRHAERAERRFHAQRHHVGWSRRGEVSFHAPLGKDAQSRRHRGGHRLLPRHRPTSLPSSGAAGAQVFGEVERTDVMTRRGSSRTAPTTQTSRVEIGSADLFLRSAAFPVQRGRTADPKNGGPRYIFGFGVTTQTRRVL